MRLVASWIVHRSLAGLPRDVFRHVSADDPKSPTHPGRLPARVRRRPQVTHASGTSAGTCPQTTQHGQQDTIPQPETVKRTSCAICEGARDNLTGVYFTDRGIEELAERRGEEQVSLEWLAEQLRGFVDLHPDFETPIERLATWLARQDDDED